MAAQKEQLTAVVKRKTEENSALHRRLHGLGYGHQTHSQHCESPFI